MKILVFDVPAESGGALTILNQYYKKAIEDSLNEWIFVVSTPVLEEKENIKVLNYPWIKKSWLHRLYFDIFIAQKIVKKIQPEELLSLQNIIIPRVKVKQTLYLHQSLPFAEKRFGMIENFKLWIYQNIIGWMIIKSIQKADEVIVQTKWVRDAASTKAKVSKEKFIIQQPELNIRVKKEYNPEANKDNLFFYPAGPSVYKNHSLIVDACMLLKKQNIENYSVVFTLKGNENKYIKELFQLKEKEKLPIDFIGTININEVYDYYSRSILIFPSYIETFGLPLLEAKMHKTPILASDCAFSREILEGYDNSKCFDLYDSRYLYKLMIYMLTQ